MTIRVTGTYSYSEEDETVTRDFDETFCAEADRTDAGFFRFWIEASGEDRLQALCRLSCITGDAYDFSYSFLPFSATATVRLLDTDGTQISEQELILWPAGM